MTLYLDKRITELVNSQLPSFIREDYSAFVAFMEAYYEWLESNYGEKIQAEYGSKKLLEYADLDKTISEFMVYFTNEFLVHIPVQVLCDRKKLLKNVRKFYLARGTEKSYDLLFRIMYMDKPSFYYPTVDILRTDSGTWVQNQSIKCKLAPNIDFFDVSLEFLHKRIIGMSSGASGIVNNIITFSENDSPSASTVYELFFEKNTLYGTFSAFEKIALSDSSDNALEILPVLTNITIDNPGTNYEVFDVITITNDYNIEMTASIKEVSAVDGSITAIQIINPSLGYPIYPANNTITVTFADKGAGTASGTAILGTVFSYPGYYADTNGFLDSIKKLRDDYFYQEFSYQIISHTNIAEWMDIVKKLVHPSGTIAFAKFLIEPDSIQAGFKREQLANISILSEGSINIITNRAQEANIKVINEPIQNSRLRIGPTLRSLNRDAYRYLPSQWESDKSSDSYWADYAQYSLEDLANVSLNDLLNNDYKAF